MFLIQTHNTELRGYFNRSEVYMGVAEHGIKIGKHNLLMLTFYKDTWRYFASHVGRDVYISVSEFLTRRFFETINYIHKGGAYEELSRGVERAIVAAWNQ